MLWCEIRRFVLPGWSWSTCRLLPCVRIVPACMLIWPVPALAPVAVATIISFCPAANFSSTGSRGIKNQPTTVRLFAQSSAFICFFELTVGGVEPDHAWTAGEKMTRTGVPERQYFINRQIKKQIHAGVSVLLCLFGWVILRFRGFLSIGVAKRPAFSWTGCSRIPAKSPIESE